MRVEPVRLCNVLVILKGLHGSVESVWVIASPLEEFGAVVVSFDLLPARKAALC